MSLNHSCPGELLERFARDPDPELRLNAALTPSTPPASLELLLRDPDTRVSMFAAEHHSMPRHIKAMWQLAHDT